MLPFRRVVLLVLVMLAAVPAVRAYADMRDHPPVMQVVTSFSGPVQAYQCVFEGISNDAVREFVLVRNRSTKQVTGVTIRYRWYDESGVKLFDNVAAVPAELDSDERAKLGPPNGFGEPNDKVSRIVCSITKAVFSDGSTWVSGNPYKGKLLPAAFSQDTSTSK